jgi:hypothetical protein
MKTEHIPIPASAPGTATTLTVHRFGTAGSRPRIYMQAALHADEIPGMLTAHRLRERLHVLEGEGRITGEIVLVPVANPLGLGQRVLGSHIGRFDLSDGLNFNRNYPYLVPTVAERIKDGLNGDAEANVRVIREALVAELAATPATGAAEHLKRILVGLAIEADVVLDLHCDSEAVMHLYTLTPTAETFRPLAALLGAEAVLLATDSGDHPFDEACSRPWHELAERFPDHDIPLACQATTLELRGEGDVSHEYAEADAAAILDFLILRGAIRGETPNVPEARCEPTPLVHSEPIVAPATGIVAFHRRPGDRVCAGETIADIVDPLTGAVTPAVTHSDGVLYARVASRFTGEGRRLGKVAGTTFHRSGKLLSP